MRVERRVVAGVGVVLMACLFGVGLFAAEAGHFDQGRSGDERSAGAGSTGATAVDRPGSGVRIGHLSLGNVHDQPLSVGLTVERDGVVVHDSTYDLPAGERQDGGAFSGTSIGVLGWERPGRYVVTVTLPETERRIDVASRVERDCATVFLTVQAPESLWVTFGECASGSATAP